MAGDEKRNGRTDVGDGEKEVQYGAVMLALALLVLRGRPIEHVHDVLAEHGQQSVADLFGPMTNQ